MSVKIKLTIACAAVVAAVVAPARDFPVAEKTGAAIQAAIDAANAAGGGRVVVPAGVYPSGTLRLKSHVELHLEKGAVVQGGTNGSCYARFPVKEAKMGRSLLQAYDAEDIAITGEGAFDCRGISFFDTTQRRWKVFYMPKPGRPEMVLFHRCRNVKFRDVSFLNSPSWTMRLRLCENLDFARIKVRNDLMFINADGIDFDGCRHVRLRDSDFLTGDDSIILRAICGEDAPEGVVMEDFMAENCRLESACQCIRIGCPSDDTIRDARFRNLTLKGRNGIFFDFPARYLSRRNDGCANIHNLVFEDFTGDLSGLAVGIVCEPGIKIRGVRDVVFRNFDLKCAGKRPLNFRENDYSRIERVRRENFTLNGERLADGPIVPVSDGTKPLRRVKKGEYNYKEPMPFTPGKFLAAGTDMATIQRALDEAGANETGGRVAVPAGTYAGSLRLPSRVELRLEKGAVLKGVGGTPVLESAGAADVALVGEGRCEGAVSFRNCRRVRVDGVAFASPVKFGACDGVEVDGVKAAKGMSFEDCRNRRGANNGKMLSGNAWL